jgi:hypothetical protein
MHVRERTTADAWLRPLRTVQWLLLLAFALVLYGEFLRPMHARSLDPRWWTWMVVALPLLLAGVIEALIGAVRPPRVDRDIVERLGRLERT